MSITRVVNVKKEECDIFIGRPSVWGNPFVIGVDGSRSAVIDKYKHYLQKRKDLLSLLPALKGKTLGCFCKPQLCHGDVLVKLLEEGIKNDTISST